MSRRWVCRHTGAHDHEILMTAWHRYDTRTTIFSPEGRLYQVEYAIEAISNAGSAIGVLASDGVVLAAEKRITSKARL